MSLCRERHPDIPGVCVLDFPHAGEPHENPQGTRWEREHGDAGLIVDMAARFAGRTLDGRVAKSLMIAFGTADPKSNISRYPASYVATFVDMARAIIEEFDISDREPEQGAQTDG